MRTPATCEGHELPGKWKVAKQMVGRRLSQEEAKRLLAKLEGLRRVHWSKEASSLAFALPYWSIPIKLNWKHWVIHTMVETIIRRWCCHVGGNNFISPW